MRFDPIKISLFTELFSSVAEEMGSVLERVSFSPNIKERRDYSCALFDPEGFLVAQAAHIPVHLGAMEFLLRRWLNDGPEIEEGRLYVTNDPFFAGTHLPDISVLRAVYSGGRLIGFVAARAHHSDVGGSAPGSFAPTENIEDEGLLIRPQALTPSVYAELEAVARSPEERKGDLDAQAAANEVGARRLAELYGRHGETYFEKAREAQDYAEELTRTALAKLPGGDYTAEDSLEDIPGEGVIRLRLSAHAAGITFDFTGTSPQVAMGVNATEAVTRSACYYIVRCLAPDAPTNGGCWRPVEVIAPEGSLVNASAPAPVVAGNTETSQRIVDVILQALAQARPDLAPACSQGTMNNLAIGSDRFAYYETIAGGAGAGPLRNGASAIHSHMTNTRNTPTEALEIELPLLVRRYELRRGSGGPGRHRGGDGVVRDIECLMDGLTLSLMTDRRRSGAPGTAGGGPGLPGGNTLVSGGSETLLPSKCVVGLNRGDRIVLETPGGGGWGAAEGLDQGQNRV